MIQGHTLNAYTYISTNSNPANCKPVMSLLKVGLIGRLKVEETVAGGNDGSGSNQAPCMTTWNHRANMGMGICIGGAPTMMTPR